MLKKIICFVFLLPLMLVAGDVSIADFLSDPGFEKPHKELQQLNAKGVKAVNGWKATPKNGNAWTSVNYMNKKGMAPGDRRSGIAPAEGKSYMRMLTVNSCNWLLLQSPSFQLKKGTTYSLCFDVSSDNKPPMSKLNVFLLVGGKKYCSKTYDMIALKPGWNTIIYRVKYNGPNKTGFLNLRGLRSSKIKVGSLCFDNFRTPTKADFDNKNSPPEVSGKTVKIKTEVSTWGQKVLPLSNNDTAINIDVLPGKYHLLLKLRSSDRSGNEGDSMLGGYTYFLPFSRYKVNLDGKALNMKISSRMVNGAGREKNGTAVFTGWLYSDVPVSIKKNSNLTISCAKAGGFVSEVMLLDTKAWDTEKLLSSNLFTKAPGKGFGNAWTGMTYLPVRWYLVANLKRLNDALGKFSSSKYLKQVNAKVDFNSNINNGRNLVKSINSFLKKKVSLSRKFQQDGAIIAANWEKQLSAIDFQLKKQLKVFVVDWDKRLNKVSSQVNIQCAAGREALFNAKIAKGYLKAGRKLLDNLNPSRSVPNAQDEIRTLTYLLNAAEFLAKAEHAAAQDQTSQSFNEYFVDSNLQAKGKKLSAEESLIINGIWDYAPGRAGIPPINWSPAPIPSNGPAFFHNPNNISDEQWLKEWGAYWRSSTDEAWFRTDFMVPEKWQGNRIVLRFEELTMYGEIFINGKFVKSHTGGFIPFEIDISDYAVPGKKNHLLVYVAAHTKTQRGKKRGNRDHDFIYGNLYPRSQLETKVLRISGNVELAATPKVWMKDIYVQTSVKSAKITVSGTIVNDTNKDLNIKIDNTVFDKDIKALEIEPLSVEVFAGDSKYFTVSAKWQNPEYWGIGGKYGDPKNIYTLVTSAVYGKQHSKIFTNFGFRELAIEGRHFTLNGKILPLQGDSYMDSGRYNYLHNRWVQAFNNQLRRQAYINLVRPHRFNMTSDTPDAANWTGMLLEGEAPWWGLYAPEDITGKLDYKDPVWLANCEDYYRTVLKANRNQPSMLMWAVDNESMNYKNASAVAQFQKWSQETAPHIISSSHSHASAWDKRFPTAILHDYELGVKREKEYMRVSAEYDPKPFIMGEYWNAPLYRKIWTDYNSVTSGANERIMAKWLARSIKSHFKLGAAGVMPFTFHSLGALDSNRSVDVMGPWGDLLMKNKKTIVVRPTWPSLSGKGGQRPTLKKVRGGDNYTNLNIFDPTRPVATLTKVVKDGYRKGFSPMPMPSIMRPPELIVEVSRAGKALPGINVFSKPLNLSGSRTGVKSDPKGKAWLQPAQDGKYIIEIQVDGKQFKHKLELKGSKLGNTAGWAYLPKLKLDVANGKFSYIPGEKAGVPIKKTKAKTLDKKITKRKDYSNHPAVNSKGYISRWLIYGPFPNYGGREEKDSKYFNQDYLGKFGGEKALKPVLGIGESIDFKIYEPAYWEKGKINIVWREFAGKKDKINLLKAFQHFEFPGLDGSIQYVFGYACCWVKSDTARNAKIAIGSDDGYKLWLNGKLIVSKRVYRGCELDKDKYSVKLKKGWNFLLVKIEQDSGAYEFALRFLDAADKALNLKTVTRPPNNIKKLTFNPYLRNWLICGPFANGKGRPVCAGYNKDYLNGEATTNPKAGDSLESVFPEDDVAYWEPGKLKVKWTNFASASDKINLGRALRRGDFPGLDGTEVEYVVGYAFKSFSLVSKTKAILRVESYNGIKIFLNGKEVLNDHKHTMNRDPSSVVLAPSKPKNINIDVNLKAGINRLLIKIDVDFGPLDFKLKFIKK